VHTFFILKNIFSLDNSCLNNKQKVVFYLFVYVMINKKIILNLIFVCTMFAFLGFSMAQVSLKPIYSPDRFQPSDKFHAGCENQMDVIFDLE